MTDEPIPTEDDALDDRLRSGFAALARAAGEPSPLPDRPSRQLPELRRSPDRLLIAAAIIAVVALLGGLALVATDDGSPHDQLRAGKGPTTTTAPPPISERKPPPAGDQRLLVCPPELLDLTRLAATPVVAPDPGIDGTADSVGPYELTWEQDGATVRLQYPEMFWELDYRGGKSEHDELGDFDEARTAITYRNRPSIGAVLDGTSGIEGDACSQYGLVVEASGKGAAARERKVFVAVAEAVRLHVPPGTATVPDVTGMGRTDAQDRLARAGFVPSWPWTYVASDPTPVTAQEPAAGTQVPSGTEVTLTVDDRHPLLPETPIACPMGRLQVDSDILDPTTEVPGATVNWKLDGGTSGYRASVSWPNRIAGSTITPTQDPSFDQQNAHRLTIGGRPALMHDDPYNGPNLVFDTGLPGTCRFLEITVYGSGTDFAERSRRAIEFATSKITIAPPPTGTPPDVIGLPLRAAVDRLSRAGFAADWGDDHDINDEVPPFLPVPKAPVTGQTRTEPGVVRLTT